MNAEEKALKDGLKKVMSQIKNTEKVSDLNRGFNDGVRRGKEWQMTMALICSFIAFTGAMVATLLSAGEVKGRKQGLSELQLEQSANFRMQQKIMQEELKLLQIKSEILEKKVNKL